MGGVDQTHDNILNLVPDLAVRINFSIYTIVYTLACHAICNDNSEKHYNG